MATIAHYIAKAEECERQAAAVTSDAVRGLLLDAARGWRRIAEIPGLKGTETDGDQTGVSVAQRGRAQDS